MRTPLTISFAFVATHNHFVLDRGGKVFKQSAPIIKLPESATEDDHLALLAYLNSSTACFWMKQVFHDKGNRGEGGGFTSESWERFFEFSGTPLMDLPLPRLDAELVRLGRALSSAGMQRQQIYARVAEDGQKDQLESIEALIRGLQEELDWHVYGCFSLLAEHAPKPRFGRALRPGERACDVRFARQVLNDKTVGGRYFELARLGAPERIAADPAFDEVIDAIALNSSLKLLENLEYKRTYREGFRPVDIAARHLQQALAIAEAHVAHLQAPTATRSVEAAVGNDEVGSRIGIFSDAVPFLAGHRFTAAGLTKHADWQRAWTLQRREDLGESVGAIPVPPKYDVKDFLDPNYFRLRGKLDVPKERFISYPGCQKDGDDSPLIGWAGWNHLQRAQALISLYQERKAEDGWPKERLMPMLVGLHELMFWLELWHSAPEAGSQNPAREVRQYLDAELNAHRLTTSDLEAWRPEAKKPRKPKKPVT